MVVEVIDMHLKGIEEDNLIYGLVKLFVSNGSKNILYLNKKQVVKTRQST